MAMCIMRDTISGHPGNWRVHGKAALRVVRDLLMTGVEPTSSAHILAEQFLFLAAVGNIQTGYDLQDMVARLPDTEHYLSKQHGVTKTLIGFIGLINHLSREGDAERDPSALDELELRLYLQAAPTLGVYDPFTISIFGLPGPLLTAERALGNLNRPWAT
jgi:hypothetical protein